MIRGSVNDELEPWIELTIQNQRGEGVTIQALLDTGFNGFLTLPASWLLDLGLECITQVRVTLADGHETISDVYTALALWNGTLIEVDVEAADTDPLVGMALLAGHDLQMRVVPNGEVAISRVT